ncbi:MAG: hypothetical protein ACHQ5A_00905 [Opitutales bacterium]
MRYFCTYFDRNYLTRGLALHRSLLAQAGEFELVVLCMDEETEAALRPMALRGVRLLPIAELTGLYPRLAAARTDRTLLEFYFTCTPWLMRHGLPRVPESELLTYLDADLYFFGSPDAVYAEIGTAPVAITPHRFPPSLAHLERYGRYNVGWVSLRHEATGLACATDWADQCAVWCFNQLESDRYADQKYLDAWSTRYPGTVSLRHPGVNSAPWNIQDGLITPDRTGPQLNGQPLIFYHFHALTHLGRRLYDPGLHKYDAVMTPGLREHVYLPYLRELHAGEMTPGEAADVLPPGRSDDPRAGLAVPHLLALLQASELDRAIRLSAIEENKAATQQTIVYLKQVEKDRDRAQSELDQTVTYLRAVEKDSAERLGSIHFYQDKLKTAYADLERNVAYLKRLEAEIAAHIQVQAAKDKTIAEINQQLQDALQRRPAGP